MNLSSTAPEASCQDIQVGGTHYRKAKLSARNLASIAKSGILQPWHVWQAFSLDPWAASAVAYILRAGKKGPALEDLQKARHYLDEMIEQVSK